MYRKDITQQDIANRVGLDRTTVSKVLSGAPGTYAGDRARKQILSLAAKLGYSAGRLRQRQAKTRARRSLEIPVEVRVMLADGSTYAKGSAAITKLTEKGADLADIKLESQNIPIAPCYLWLDFPLAGRDMHLRGDISRLYLIRFPRISVKFVEMLESDALHIARHAPRLGDGSE